MSEEEIKECLAELLKNSNTSIRLTRELTKTVVTASTQIVGAGEAIHAGVREVRAVGERFDSIAELADDDSKKTGSNQVQITSKQETLLDIQIANARLTRIQIIMLIIGMVITGAVGLLGFFKWYAKLP